MAERKWTEAQLDAINRSGKNILISAAAGSGKTAVLTARIIKKLTDSENPADISRMLIVTFTKAAANELKERIGTAITEAISKNPSDNRLKKQYLLLQNAKISTIHGFCLDLIKKNFEKLGIGPSISVSDQAQASLMMEQVANTVIDNYYSALPGYTDIECFSEFADNFISLKDDKLSDLLISVYNKVSSFPRGIEFINDSANELDKVAKEGIYSSVWGEIIINHLEDTFSYYAEIFSDACRFFNDGDVYQDKYLPSFEYEYKFVSELLRQTRLHDIEGVKATISNRAPLPLKPLKKDYQTDECLFYRSAKSEFSSKLSKITELFFSQTDETIRQTAEKTRIFVHKLYLFLSSFNDLYTAEKRKRNLLDFNDLERTAYNLLVNEKGKPTDVAGKISLEYDDIYIDEYQDVNKLQDMIFSSISKDSCRFMVGDIKQSIYGFRGAEPSLFADYRKNSEIDKIFLRHNFRCDSPIINFVNLVCGNLFRSVGKTVPYDNTDELVCGKENGGSDKVEIHLVSTGKCKAPERREAEADFVAKRISELLSQGYRPNQICILLRSASRSAATFEKSLENLKISCKNQVVKNLFVNPEVLLVMNILNVIDNPSRDIYLAGALKSPIFNFSLTDLVKIRRYTSEGSLFSALKKYTEDFDFGKGKYFLKKFEEFRKLSLEPVDKLIWRIYRDTHIFSLATGGGVGSSVSEKKANLLLLYDYARKFESGKFKGLYSFIRYINDVLESGAAFEGATSSDADNSVQIMTIHQSKGLEFPVVFLCDTSAEFSSQDLHEKVLIDRNYLTTMKLADKTGLATYDTIMRRAEGIGILQKNCDEEIRVLYVALTRAVNKLIITSALPDPNETIANCRELIKYSNIANGYAYRISNDYISWILMSSLNEYTPNIIESDNNAEKIEESAHLSATLKAAPSYDESEILSFETEFRNRFDFEYNKQASLVPAKLSVSELYPEVIDEFNESFKITEEARENMKKPRFVSETQFSSADKGTATHQFMQFCNFSLLEKNGVDEEINRLLKNGYIDCHTSELIEKEAVNRFLSSPLFISLRDAKYIKRELRFNIKLPAKLFSSDENVKAALENESLLVQGIIDCLFIDSKGNLTILDYKTDRIPFEYRSSQKTADEFLISRHINQLSYYRLACEKMMCRKVDRVLLYSFSLSRIIEIPNERFS